MHYSPWGRRGWSPDCPGPGAGGGGGRARGRLRAQAQDGHVQGLRDDLGGGGAPHGGRGDAPCVRERGAGCDPLRQVKPVRQGQAPDDPGDGAQPPPGFRQGDGDARGLPARAVVVPKGERLAVTRQALPEQQRDKESPQGLCHRQADPLPGVRKARAAVLLGQGRPRGTDRDARDLGPGHRGNGAGHRAQHCGCPREQHQQLRGGAPGVPADRQVLRAALAVPQGWQDVRDVLQERLAQALPRGEPGALGRLLRGGVDQRHSLRVH